MMLTSLTMPWYLWIFSGIALLTAFVLEFRHRKRQRELAEEEIVKEKQD